MRSMLATLVATAAIILAAMVASYRWPTPSLARSDETRHNPSRRILPSTPPPAAPSDARADVAIAAAAPTSALQAAEQIHALRSASAYARMAELIRPDRRENTLALLIAIDGVLDADADLHRIAEEVYGFPLPPSWNLCVMADNLGVFSTHVRFTREDIHGNHAEVTLQEGDNVPLVHAQFERIEGAWYYVPESIQASAIPQLKRLAVVVRDVAESIHQGAPINSLADAFTFRILPQVARVIQHAEPRALAAGPDTD